MSEPAPHIATRIDVALAASGEHCESNKTIELLALARAGDRTAIAILYARHFPRLRRWASGRLPRWARDINETQDLVQDALLQVLRHLDRFEPRQEGALQAYLRQTVLNRVRDELRRARRRPDVGPLSGFEVVQESSPLEATIRNESVTRYEVALERLRPSERKLIIARLELGYSYQEMAATLGKRSPEAARKAAERAIKRLVEEMQRGQRGP